MDTSPSVSPAKPVERGAVMSNIYVLVNKTGQIKKYQFIVSFEFSIVITRKLEFKRPVKNVTKSKASRTLIR